MGQGNEFTVGAILEVKRGTSTEQVTPVTTYVGIQKIRSQVAKTKDGALGFEMLSMKVGSPTTGSVVDLRVSGLEMRAQVTSPRSELLVVEASVKPFISLVWAGAVLIIAGLGISLSTKLNGKVAP